MNDTAQETTTAMAVFVEHEVLGASLLPVEIIKKTQITYLHTAATLLYYQYL